MITVVHSFPTWLPQTQTWMYNQLRYLPDGVDAHVVCKQTEHLDQFRVPNIHCFADEPRWRRVWDKGLRLFRFRPYLNFMGDVADGCKADILHSHFGPIGWSDMSVARRADLRHVVTFYGQDVNHLPQHHPIWRQRYADLFAHVDAVLCEGHHMADRIRKLGCPGHKIRVQNLGIALDEIEFMPREWSPGQDLQVLIAAAFREKKGIPIAIEALGELRERIPLKVTLVGDAGPDPRTIEEKGRILAAVDRSGLGGTICMSGFLPHAQFLGVAREHHIFLSPSITAEDGDTEGGAPVSLIEMSAAGLLVVSTKHCDIPEVVTHRKTGLLAKERDVPGLVENVTWLVENSNRWSEMCRAARRHVEEKFDARRQGRRLANIYEALTDKG